MFYNHILTHPHDAIPYVEDALLQKREGVHLTSFQEKLLDRYKDDIAPISFNIQGRFSVNFIVHVLNLYDPITNKFVPTKPFDNTKILRLNENVWRYLDANEKFALHVISTNSYIDLPQIFTLFQKYKY
jgi:hypothetical protein